VLLTGGGVVLQFGCMVRGCCCVLMWGGVGWVVVFYLLYF